MRRALGDRRIVYSRSFMCGVVRLRGAAVGEDRGDGGRDVLRPACELAIGKAQRAVAGAECDDVACAVVLEGVAGLVVAPAVGLDDEALIGEQKVDLLAGDALVDSRGREAVGAAELFEEDLEVASG